MKIGPVDVRNHAFVKRGMRGLDEAEVRAYLELVADRLQEEVLEAEQLRARIDRIERQVEDYRQLEQSLRDSLLSAGRMADDRMAQAEKEAQIVIKNAEVEAEKVLLRSREEVARLHAAIDDLRRQRTTYVERFRALLRSQVKILEASVATFDPDAEAEEPYEPAPARPAAPAPPPFPGAGAAAPAPGPAPYTPPPVPTTGTAADPPLGTYFGGGLHAAGRREGDLLGEA